MPVWKFLSGQVPSRSITNEANGRVCISRDVGCRANEDAIEQARHDNEEETRKIGEQIRNRRAKCDRAIQDSFKAFFLAAVYAGLGLDFFNRLSTYVKLGPNPPLSPLCSYNIKFVPDHNSSDSPSGC
jgi:hypothetical protein